MLADNILFLRKNYSILYEELKKIQDKPGNGIVTVEDTKNNHKTLKIIKDGQTIFLNSKYDPLREAEAIIDKLEEREEIDADTHVIFYGLGLGYHIDSFVHRFPNTTFSLYEPSIEVFNQFLSIKNINNLPTKKIHTIQCGYESEAMDEFFNALLNNTCKKTIIMDLPVYHNVFEEQYKMFSNRFIEVIKNKRSSLRADISYQKRWITNSVINFKEVLNTPNILMQDENIFKDKTAIIVSAGPSLDDEIENLRKIKDNGLAYIFSVGSAINTLMHHNILPDAICTYDPTEKNQVVFKKINEMEISNVPMIFGSSIGFEVLQQYKGPKYHMITTQDTISNYFLKEKDNKEIRRVSDAPSIAVVALEMLYKLKFSTIILVGQNLAYKDEKNYAEGIEYQQFIDIENDKNVLKIKDVYGNEVSTCEAYISMRNQMEGYIKNFNITVINTTKGGAHIEGTKFISMDVVIKDILQKKNVQGNEFNGLMEFDIYDKENLTLKMLQMNIEYSRYKKLLIEIKEKVVTMNDLINAMNIKQVRITYNKFNDAITKLENNDFFKVIVMPMNRVEYTMLTNNVGAIRNEKNELKKISNHIKFIDIFINHLAIDNVRMQGIMEILSDYTKNSSENMI